MDEKKKDHDKLVALIKNAKKIVFFVGAGISSGLPDFRTPGTGLYDIVRTKYNMKDPEQLFCFSHHKQNPHILFEVLEEMKACVEKSEMPKAYELMKYAQDQGKLLRVYTTNFDDREERYGIDPSKIVQYHGSASKVFMQGGVQRPSIVFFGEQINPQLQKGIKHDFWQQEKIDLVFIMGTSLRVGPFNKLPTFVHGHTQRVIINREIPSTKIRDKDIVILGQIDDILSNILSLL